MKIGIVCYPTYGGSGVVATELGMALANKGHKVHFITYAEPVRLNRFNPNLYYHEVNVKGYPLFEYEPYELVLSSRIVDVALHEDLDLLHVHYAIPHASAAYLAQQILKTKGKHLPFITTLHGTDITLVGKDAAYEPVISFAINQSNAVTAVSDSLRADTFSHFSIDREIEVIPNFICVDEYKKHSTEAIKKEWSPNGEYILTHISNFRPLKRVEDVVQVFAEVRKYKAAKLLLVGDGPERAKVEQLTRQLQLCEDVHFLGNLKSTKEVLGLSDVFLLPSSSESFGLAALEAMASRTPVISSNAGGLVFVNQDGYSGFVSEIGDTMDMAKNTLKIIADRPTLSKFKDQALERAGTFSIQKILPQYEALYARVLSTTPVM